MYFKLITSSLRVGVSRLQVTQALAGVSGVNAKRMAQRLMGYTHQPVTELRDKYRRLTRRSREVVERVFYGQS